MAANAYHFITRWRVPGTVEQVADILEDSHSLPTWWPSVYLGVLAVEPGDTDGMGRVARFWTKGWLPYTLRWQSRIIAKDYPHGFSLAATGDFEGQGTWTLTQDLDIVEAVYDWRLTAEKPLLRNLSFLLKPVFEANHRWAMARGEESLALELVRRFGTADERAEVPPPPPPVPAAPFLIAGAALAAGAAFILVRRMRRTL